MKRLMLVLCLVLSAAAHADTQTWRFENVPLYADEDNYSGLPGGPAGFLTGFFSYDPAANVITDFLLNIGSTTLMPDPWGVAYFVNPTTIIFDSGYTPATSDTLKLILKQPLVAASGRIPIDTDSVFYYDYGISAIHLLGGALAFAAGAPTIPEPATSGAILLGIGLAAAARYRAQP